MFLSKFFLITRAAELGAPSLQSVKSLCEAAVANLAREPKCSCRNTTVNRHKSVTGICTDFSSTQ